VPSSQPSNPSITVYEGCVYEFAATSISLHPFGITGPTITQVLHAPEVSNNGQYTTTTHVIWQVPIGASTSQRHFRCIQHFFGGNFNVVSQSDANGAASSGVVAPIGCHGEFYLEANVSQPFFVVNDGPFPNPQLTLAVGCSYEFVIDTDVSQPVAITPPNSKSVVTTGVQGSQSISQGSFVFTPTEPGVLAYTSFSTPSFYGLLLIDGANVLTPPFFVLVFVVFSVLYVSATF